MTAFSANLALPPLTSKAVIPRKCPSTSADMPSNPRCPGLKITFHLPAVPRYAWNAQVASKGQVAAPPRYLAVAALLT